MLMLVKRAAVRTAAGRHRQRPAISSKPRASYARSRPRFCAEAPVRSWHLKSASQLVRQPIGRVAMATESFFGRPIMKCPSDCRFPVPGELRVLPAQPNTGR